MGAAVGRVFTARTWATMLACLAAQWCWAQEDALAALALESRPPSLSLNLSTPLGAPPGQAGAVPLDLGLRWRQPLASDQHVDVTTWQRVSSPADALTLVRSRETVYGARVEMKLAGGNRAASKADNGFLGLQLDSGSRIMLRRKDGNPTLYYRSRF